MGGLFVLAVLPWLTATFWQDARGASIRSQSGRTLPGAVQWPRTRLTHLSRSREGRSTSFCPADGGTDAGQRRGLLTPGLDEPGSRPSSPVSAIVDDFRTEARSRLSSRDGRQGRMVGDAELPGVLGSDVAVLVGRETRFALPDVRVREVRLAARPIRGSFNPSPSCSRPAPMSSLDNRARRSTIERGRARAGRSTDPAVPAVQLPMRRTYAVRPTGHSGRRSGGGAVQCARYRPCMASASSC